MRRQTYYLCCLMALVGLSSCHAISDGEQDCRTIVRLQYDMNMKWADAFNQEVTAVHLYVYNDRGDLVAQHHESGEALKNPDYCIPLDLDEGTYDFVAWCGDAVDNTFEQGNAAKQQNLTQRLRTDADNHSAKPLGGLYHGRITASIDLDDDNREVMIPLTKDTNSVRIILQQLSGKDVDPDMFRYQIIDDNGYIAHDNSLLESQPVTYDAWPVTTGKAGIEKSARTIEKVSCAVADLSVSRLIKGHSCTLLITRAADGKPVVRLPLIDYALLIKGNYSRPVGDQEFLDRQDEYSLTFFLDDDLNWASASILINSWRVVLSHAEL